MSYNNSDLAVITCYFNPEQYLSRRDNYTLFKNKLKYQGVPCFTIECVLGDALPELEPEPDLTVVRSRDSLWQKERLLNLALEQVPSQYNKISWLDCDILFSDYNWASKASILLDSFKIIQPFNRVAWLPPGGQDSPLPRKHETSFASSKYPLTPPITRINQHGHTGFAWAIRRDLLEHHHFYDAGILGHGDHMIAHAVHGDWDSLCLPYLFQTPEFFEHYLKWAEPFHQDVQGNISSLTGRIDHLWHGNLAHRYYRTRHLRLKKYNYNPELDIKIGSQGPWEWNSDKLELHSQVHAYFKSRREDGITKKTNGDLPVSGVSSPSSLPERDLFYGDYT